MSEYFRRVGVHDDEILAAALEELRKGRKAAICVIVSKEGSGPRDPGTKMLVREDGSVVGTLGGGPFERDVIQKALEAIKNEKPRTVKYSFLGKQKVGDAISTGLICGGIITVYIDVLKPKSRAVIMGAGHVGRPISQIFHMLGYEVIVGDMVEELLTEEALPFADIRVHGPLEDVVRKLASYIRPGDVALVVHGAPEPDYAALKEFIKSPAWYVGLLGSKRKIMELIKKLLSEGVVDAETIKKKLHAPIGIDIGARTPEEIAVSVAAEVIALKKGVNQRSLSKVAEFVEVAKNVLKRDQGHS